MVLKHRRPDDSGIAVAEAAGHTRLSILDLSDAGHQPMHSEDGNVILVYNGELYNFHELRRRLEGEGIVFTSRSDTEVVLKAFLRWGTDAFAMFNGMFALAIWNKQTRQLYLARDRFGIKPLYYTLTNNKLVFGSEIKAILASQQCHSEIDHKGLHEYLYYGYALGSNTLFNNLKKLQAGH